MTTIELQEPSKAALESLLANLPNECFELSKEDNEWVQAKPVGKELGV